MKNNFKTKSEYIFNILLIFMIFASVWTAQAQVSADRTIEKSTATAGNEINVTVSIKNNNSQPLAVLKENIPSGWTLIRISDDADGFKADANEWAWSPRAGNNTDKNVKYRIGIPANTASGTYMIDGNAVTVLNASIKVSGDEVITVTGGSTSGSGGSSGSGNSGTNPAITATVEKNEINITGSPTEAVTAQPTTTDEQETSTPVKTATPEASAAAEAPGFGAIFSIGIIAVLYILRRKK